jgi:hypothetical protein
MLKIIAVFILALEMLLGLSPGSPLGPLTLALGFRRG